MEGRRKEIILLVLAVVALGVALLTFRGQPAAPPAPAPETETAQAPDSEKPEAPAAEAERETPAAEGESEEQAAPSEGEAASRNPFSTPGASPAATGETQEGTDEPATAEQPPAGGDGEQALALTGIVAGTPTVAILRQGDQPYFVRVGDHVGEAYRVQAIGHQKVVLAGPGGEMVLRMGGRQ